MQSPPDGEPGDAGNSSFSLGSMSGTWVLDKKRGEPSMRGYLETMGVTDIAIEAHEKAELEHETYHTIDWQNQNFKIKKLSRVTDLELDLKLGIEHSQNLPDNRVKTILATSENPTQSIKIVSRLPTMNGMASVVDTKTLQRDGSGTLILVQTLVITNERSGATNTTTRYFLPHQGEISRASTAK